MPSEEWWCLMVCNCFAMKPFLWSTPCLKLMASTMNTYVGNVNENHVGIRMKKKHALQFKQPGKTNARPNKRQGSDRGRLTVVYSIKINQENAGS